MSNIKACCAAMFAGFKVEIGWFSILLPHLLMEVTSVLQRGVREIAELYGCNPSLKSIEDHRKHSGIEYVSSTCLGAARISGLLVDDGLDFDKKYDIEWHKSYVPYVGRILRIEHLAGKILDEVRTFCLRSLTYLNFQFLLCLRHKDI